MELQEAKKWILGIVIIVGVCGAYFYHANQDSNRQTAALVEREMLSEKSAYTVAFGITDKQVGENVKICGTVTNITSGKGHIFPMITDPNNSKSFPGVLFSAESAHRYNKEKNIEELKIEREEQKRLIEDARLSGKLLTFEGMVERYDGKLEIIINKVY